MWETKRNPNIHLNIFTEGLHVDRIRARWRRNTNKIKAQHIWNWPACNLWSFIFCSFVCSHNRKGKKTSRVYAQPLLQSLRCRPLHHDARDDWQLGALSCSRGSCFPISTRGHNYLLSAAIMSAFESHRVAHPFASCSMSIRSLQTSNFRIHCLSEHHKPTSSTAEILNLSFNLHQSQNRMFEVESENLFLWFSVFSWPHIPITLHFVVCANPLLTRCDQLLCHKSTH